MKRFPLLLAGLALLAGCADMERVDLPRIEEYASRLSMRQAPSPTSGETSSPAEAKALTVDACVRIALDRNPVVRAAHEGVAGAQEAVGEAWSAYYPELVANASYSRWQTHAFLPSGIAFPGLKSIVGPTDDWAAAFTARYMLFDSGERRARLLQASASRGAREEDLAAVRQDMALNVNQAFYALSSAVEAKSVADKNFSRSQDHVSLAEKRQAAGAVPKADVVRARVEEADSKLALVRAEGLVRVSKANLNAAMGLPVDMPVEIDLTSTALPPQNEVAIGEALAQAIQSRPSLKSALYGVASAKSAVSGAKSTFGPRIHLDGKYGRRDSDFFPEDKDWMIGVFLEWPLFTGFSSIHRLARAESELSGQEAQLEAQILSVQREVASAHSGLREAFEAVNAAEALVADATESHRLSRQRYDAGAATMNDLLDAETALARAELQRTTARWDYRNASAVFQRAIGMLQADDLP